jgi:hypothetical protein
MDANSREQEILTKGLGESFREISQIKGYPRSISIGRIMSSISHSHHDLIVANCPEVRGAALMSLIGGVPMDRHSSVRRRPDTECDIRPRQGS